MDQWGRRVAGEDVGDVNAASRACPGHGGRVALGQGQSVRQLADWYWLVKVALVAQRRIEVDHPPTPVADSVGLLKIRDIAVLIQFDALCGGRREAGDVAGAEELVVVGKYLGAAQRGR